MHTIILTALVTFVYHSLSFIAFGLVMEIVFTALSDYILKPKDPNSTVLRGYVSIYMIPIYGVLLPLLYEPAFLGFIAIGTPWYIRMVFWAVLISAMEALTGFLYDKYLGVRPWDYSKCKDKVFANGYTRWLYVPLWGGVGMVLEPFSRFLTELSPYVYKVIFMS